MIGTQEYMAPELRQADKRTEFGQEVDIFSFGILLWELFTGKTATEFYNNQKQAMFKRSSNIKFPPGFPVWVGKLISKCTATQPHKRFTARKVLDKLNGYLNPTTTPVVGRVRSKGSFIKQSAPVEQPTKPPALWFWKDSFGTCRKFSTEGCVAIEAYYQQLRDNNVPFELQEASLQGTFTFSSNEFYIKDVESSKTYTVDRKRVAKGDATTELRVERENGPGDNILFTVVGSPDPDCSDAIFSVTYCYRDEKKIVQNYTTRRPPYHLSIPPCQQEWIAVHISLDTLPHQVIEFTLDYSPTPRYHTIQLESPRSMTPHIFNKYSECSNSDLEKLEKEVFAISATFVNETIDYVLLLSSKQSK